MLRRLVLIVPALVAVGCSCNEQEYSFPDREPPVDGAEAPAVWGDHLSFDVAPEGERITVAYHEYDFGAVGFAVGTPEADGSIDWRHERVDGYPGSDGRDPGDRGKHTSHRVAPDGTVWLAYSDMAAGGLYVSHREGPDTWTEAELVEPGAGGWSSLALDPDGNPVIAHVGLGGAKVRVSRLGADGAWTGADAYTSTAVVVPAPDTGSSDTVRPAAVTHTSMAIRDDGTELIAFRDAASGELILLEGTDGAWTPTIVDGGDTGAWADLVVDGETVWIAYQDVAAQDLMVATREGGGAFTIDTVDTGQLRGADTALVVNDGRPTLAYFDGWDGDLRLARRSGGAWSTERLAGETTASGFHNAVVTVAAGTWVGTWDMSTKEVSFLQVDGPATETTAE